MAERRMVSKKIIDTDLFLDMPTSSRLLYYDFLLRADDEGFINSPKKITRMIGASEDDFKLLILKKFIIPFESGICVIKDWKIHNYIRSDRFKETVYIDEKALLELDSRGSYNLKNNNVIPGVIPDVIPDVIPMVDPGKVRLELGKSKDKIIKDKEKKEKKKKQTYFDLINNFTDNKLLQQAINDWIEMRALKKAKLTNTALQKTLDKIKTMVREDDINRENTMIAIFDQSTMNSWTGIFPLKTNEFNQNQDNHERVNGSRFLALAEKERKKNELRRIDENIIDTRNCISELF